MVANDPGLFELAEALAARAVSQKGDMKVRLQYMFRLALCRTPSPEELVFLEEFIVDQRREFKMSNVGSESNASLFAWIATARVLMNLDEFITRE